MPDTTTFVFHLKDDGKTEGIGDDQGRKTYGPDRDQTQAGPPSSQRQTVAEDVGSRGTRQVPPPPPKESTQGGTPREPREGSVRPSKAKELSYEEKIEKREQAIVNRLVSREEEYQAAASLHEKVPPEELSKAEIIQNETEKREEKREKQRDREARQRQQRVLEEARKRERARVFGEEQILAARESYYRREYGVSEAEHKKTYAAGKARETAAEEAAQKAKDASDKAERTADIALNAKKHREQQRAAEKAARDVASSQREVIAAVVGSKVAGGVSKAKALLATPAGAASVTIGSGAAAAKVIDSHTEQRIQDTKRLSADVAMAVAVGDIESLMLDLRMSQKYGQLFAQTHLSKLRFGLEYKELKDEVTGSSQGLINALRDFGTNILDGLNSGLGMVNDSLNEHGLRLSDLLLPGTQAMRADAEKSPVKDNRTNIDMLLVEHPDHLPDFDEISDFDVKGPFRGSLSGFGREENAEKDVTDSAVLDLF